MRMLWLVNVFLNKFNQCLYISDACAHICSLRCLTCERGRHINSTLLPHCRCPSVCRCNVRSGGDEAAAATLFVAIPLFILPSRQEWKFTENVRNINASLTVYVMSTNSLRARLKSGKTIKWWTAAAAAVPTFHLHSKINLLRHLCTGVVLFHFLV